MWLGSFKTPQSESISFKVARRSLELKQYLMAAEMSAFIVRSLHEEGAGARGGIKAPAVISASVAVAAESTSGPWKLEMPKGGDALPSCELAVTSLITHIIALKELHQEGQGSGTKRTSELAKVVPCMLGWLEALVNHHSAPSGSAPSGSGDVAKENSKPTAVPTGFSADRCPTGFRVDRRSTVLRV